MQLRKEFDQDKRELWESRLTDYRPVVDKTYAQAKTDPAKVEQSERRAAETQEVNFSEGSPV